MYPDNESHLSSKGNSQDHQPTSGVATPSPADDDCHHHSCCEEEAVIADDVPPNTTNSATMTCPEWGGGWPPPPPPPLYPCCPYAGGGGGLFCYPPPPTTHYFTAPATYAGGYPFQATLRPPPPYYNNNNNNTVNMTASGVSVGAHQSHSNTSSVQENIDHALAASSPPIYYNGGNLQPFAYPYPYPPPAIYNPPNPHQLFLQSHFGVPLLLTAGQMFPPTTNNNNNQSGECPRSRTSSLCPNCSTEIIVPTVEEVANVEDLTACGRSPLNITSFTDSVGRVWKCTGTRTPHRKTAIARGGREAAGVGTPARVASPSVERRPATAASRDESGLPLRKKRTNKLRAARRNADEPPVCAVVATQRHCSPASTRPASAVAKVPGTPRRTQHDAYAGTGGGSTPAPRPKGASRRAPPPPTAKDESAAPNEAATKTCKRTDAHEAASTLHDACPKKTQQATPAEQADDDDRKGDVTLDEGPTPKPTPEDAETEDKASCNDFLKRNAAEMRTDQKEDEGFWSSSSSTSSSGTYDDSEAFDSFKLLSDAGLTAEAMTQSRQRSRDRLFRRRVGGSSKLSIAQSEEALKKRRRRSASPGSRPGDEQRQANNDQQQQPQQQVIVVDTSQVRITEETPKRFIVESKDGGASTSSSKGMTITVQSEVPARGVGVQCELCADGSCTCDAVPPCQRPQWQASPCPANEIHGTPVHHCHNPAVAVARSPQVHYQRGHHRRANSPPPHAGESLLARDVEGYNRRGSPPRRGGPCLQAPAAFGLAPWGGRNADRPREENRHPHYIPPRPSTERLDDPRRDQHLRSRRWHGQSTDSSDVRRAEEMLRIQIPNSFPRYRPYEYGRSHTGEDLGAGPADVGGAGGGADDEGEGRHRSSNTIDINIFRGASGVRRLGTVRRVVRCGSPRSRGEAPPPSRPLAPPHNHEDDPEAGLDFYRRPRSAITVSKTNYFSPRNRKLEEEVQRMQSADYEVGGAAAAPGGGAKGGEENEDNNKPDCEYEEETDDRKRDMEDEED